MIKVKNLKKGSKFSEVTKTELTGLTLADHKSFGISSNHKLYLFDSEYYWVLSKNATYSLDKVEDKADTFIPTTTIGITENRSGLSNRTALDDVNLLSSMRRNKLITGITKAGVTRETSEYEYFLDAPIEDSRLSLNDLLAKIKITAVTIEAAAEEPATQEGGDS